MHAEYCLLSKMNFLCRYFSDIIKILRRRMGICRGKKGVGVCVYRGAMNVVYFEERKKVGNENKIKTKVVELFFFILRIRYEYLMFYFSKGVNFLYYRLSCKVDSKLAR